MARLSNTRNAKARSQGTSIPVVTNLAGGRAYAQSPKLELVNLILSSFLANDMYRDEKQIRNRIKELVKQIPDKDFVAKAALFARNEFGMRTMSHLVAGEIANQNLASGTEWGRHFFNAIVHRLDDMMEILGYYLGENPNHALPNALKGGFASAFNRFDAYSLAKYKGANRAVKLVDVVRLVRPRPTSKNEAALKGLLDGTLKNVDTWESKISASGKVVGDKAKAEARNEAWGDLIKAKKLGYLALVRNLTNIANDTDDATFALALELLKNREQAVKSLILPFQLYIAYKTIESEGRIVNTRRRALVLDGLSFAVDAALANIPKMEGKTLVAVDISGSMTAAVAAQTELQCVELAALFGVALAKANGADLMLFNDTHKMVPVMQSRSTIEQARQYARTSGGTSFDAIFNGAGNDKYDRIFILSDMQAWMQSGWAPDSKLKAYKARAGANPYIYSFDLTGKGTMQVPEDSGKVIALAGWSDKVFDLLKTTEQDRQVLIKKIEAYEIKLPVRERKPKAENAFIPTGAVTE
jgi:hypothetical protein